MFVGGGGAGNDTITVYGGNEATLYGGAGDDVLRGGWLPILAFGGDGNDRIDPGDYSDTVWGGAGDDTIDAAEETASEDVFIFAAGHGNDVIMFEDMANDIIDLQYLDARFNSMNELIAASELVDPVTEYGNYAILITTGENSSILIEFENEPELSDLMNYNFVL